MEEKSVPGICNVANSLTEIRVNPFLCRCMKTLEILMKHANLMQIRVT